MVTQWMIDTNGWILLLKGGQQNIANRLAQQRDADIFLCSIVKGELLHGALKYGNHSARMEILNAVFQRYQSHPFDDAAAGHYADIRHHLEVNGTIIGPNDLKIAAIARTHHLVLVTTNVREFSRVPGLKIEDWS